MKFTALILIALTSSPSARAEEILEFNARIQSEALAEEAIDLLHCVAGRLGLSWQLSESRRAAYWLELKEQGGGLEGQFKSPSGEKPVRLGLGESGAACSELAPPESAAPEIAWPASSPEPETKTRTWLLVGAAVAVAAGGYLLWKSRPDHRSIRFE